MSILTAETELPTSLDLQQAVDVAYATELAEIAGNILRGLPLESQRLLLDLFTGQV